MKIALNHEKLRYTGRIDTTSPGRPEFIYPASSLEFAFYGTGAAVKVVNRNVCWDNYLGIIVDGEQSKAPLRKTGSTTVVLARNLEEKEHRIMVFKRQDSCHTFALEELELYGSGEVRRLPERPRRRIEVYGDSVSAGEVSEALDYVGKADPEHQGQYSNSWHSYAWIAARRLGAQIHDIAQGGIALLDGTGWFCQPGYLGMESAWDKVHYNPELGKTTDWDFSRYTPHVVVVAIGQNDSHPVDFMKEEPEGRRARHWKMAYGEWICRIREKYPRAVIILTTTLLRHDPSWDKAIGEVCGELNKKDPDIHHLLYSRNGAATPGHLRIPEAEEMAGELCEFIESMPDGIWED